MKSSRFPNGPFNGKMRRLVTSLVLPIDSKRSGSCKNCGACCEFLVKCPFLEYSDDDPPKARCKAYAIRPLQCRKYPRTNDEQIHEPCGYHFEQSER